jgi:hypothetical protein
LQAVLGTFAQLKQLTDGFVSSPQSTAADWAHPFAKIDPVLVLDCLSHANTSLCALQDAVAAKRTALASSAHAWDTAITSVKVCSFHSSTAPNCSRRVAKVFPI